MRVLFAGGGTGGHVYPAIAMIDELRRRSPSVEVAYVGTRRGLEARILPKWTDVRFFPIRVRGIPRGRPLGAVRALAELAVALVESIVVLVRVRPHVVIGVGGYSSFPPLLLAAWLGRLFPIRTLVHEQNVVGGLANRLLARFVDVVMVSFRESAASFPRARKLVVTGNPIREEMLHVTRSDEAYRRFGLDPERRTILVFGGSTGSIELTEAIRRDATRIAEDRKLQILVVTGDDTRTRALADEMRAAGAANVVVRTYVEEMGHAFAVADLVVCRSGATSLAEITACGKASLLVPWRGAADDHQRKNAGRLRADGACAVADDELVARGGLVRLMQEIAGDDARLDRLARNARRSGRTGARAAIFAEIVGRMRGAHA